MSSSTAPIHRCLHRCMPRCAAALDACAWHVISHHGALPRVSRCAAAFDACADGSHPMVCRACECEGCRRSLPRSGRRRGSHALRWAPRWAPHWVATQTRRRRHRQLRPPRPGRGRPRRRASWRRATVCRYRSSSHAVRVGSCVWARRMSRPSRTVHGLCATPTPSSRHSGERECSRITPPRPSASLVALPVSAAGRGSWAPQACAEHHGLALPSRTRSAAATTRGAGVYCYIPDPSLNA